MARENERNGWFGMVEEACDLPQEMKAMGEKEKEGEEGGNNDSRHLTAASSGSIPDADSRTIADVLNEVNEFIDTLDDGADWGRDLVNPVGVGYEGTDVGGGDDDDAVNDSEKLISSLGDRYRPTSEAQRVVEDDAVSGPCFSDLRNMSGHHESDVGVRVDAIKHENDINDQFLPSSLHNRDDANQTEETCGKKFNNISSSCYQNSMATSNEISDNIMENSTAGSANSGGGSSVENMPPSSGQLHLRPYHQLRSRQQQLQLSPRVPLINSMVPRNIGLSLERSNALAKTNNGSSKTDDPPREVPPVSANESQVMAQRRLTTNHKRNRESTSERWVSIVLKISPRPLTTGGEEVEVEEGDEADADGYGPILFPALVGGGDDNPTAADDEMEAVSSKQIQLRSGEVILVNPHAFDTREKDGDASEGRRKNNDSIINSSADKSKERLAGRVTVETARLVAEVSQISSEDWARKYQFDYVCWPPRRCKSLLSSNHYRFNDDHSYPMSALASSAVERVLNRSCNADANKTNDRDTPCSTIIFAVGGSASGKTQTIFGSSLASLVSSATGTRSYPKNDVPGYGHSLGLLGEIVSGILSSQHANDEGNICDSMIDGVRPALKCSLSILEIVSGDVLRDVLTVSEEGLGKNGGSKCLRVQHMDARGAAVLNLRQATVETMEQLYDVLNVSFKSNILRRAWISEGGHGHFIVTICVYRPNGYCAKILLADLAGPDRHTSSATTLVDVRKSLSALRGVLRGLVEQHTNHTNSPMPYRESTLTKLLQRSIDASTRSFLIGTVSTSTKSYNQTLATMDFMSRILAKAGETALSPFHDAVLPGKTARSSDRKYYGESTKDSEDAGVRIRSIDDAQTASQTPPRNSSMASLPLKGSLKNITSDPRQRLAKLLGSAPRTKGGNKIPRGAVHINKVDFPNSNVSSNEAKSRKYRENYGDVLTRLDLLMDADDDDLDRNSFEEDIIDALTPYKARGTNDGSSIDSSEGVTPSPFRLNSRTIHSENSGRLGKLENTMQQNRRQPDELDNGIEDTIDALTPNKARGANDESFIDSSEGVTPSPFRLNIRTNHSDNNSRLGKLENKMQQDRRQLDELDTGIVRDDARPTGSNEDNLHKTESPEPHQRIDWLPKKLHMQVGDTNSSANHIQSGGRNIPRAGESIFVERSKVMISSLDSIDSEEPLVSARGQGNFFGDPEQHTSTHLSSPLNSFDVPSSPTYAILESFKDEIDTLVVKLTEDPKTISDNSTVDMLATSEASATALEGSATVAEEKRHLSDHSFLENQISSLTQKVQSLRKEKIEAEAFLSKIRTIIYEVGETKTATRLRPQDYEALEDMIKKRQSLLIKLESQLDSSQTEKNNLSREIERAQEKISELFVSVQDVEMDHVEARAHAPASLESNIERLKEKIVDSHNSQHSSSVFFGRLDKLLRISTDRSLVFDESQHEIRLDIIKNLQSRSHDGSRKLKESQNNVILLESKTQELEYLLRMSQEAQTQMKSERQESEKLCEEAVSASENLAKEVGGLRSELANEEKAHQMLLTSHNAALKNNEELSREYDRIKSQMVERDHEISRLNVSLTTCLEEKAQLNDQVVKIGAKTFDVMKKHIERLREDYTKRLEEFKADYVLDLEKEELSRLRLDLSKKEAENAGLRMRIEDIEKSTSLKIHNAEEKLNQIQEELTSASKEASNHREEKNLMKEELDQLRSLMDIAEDSVGELNRLKEENLQLIGMIRSQNDHDSRLSSIDVPFEIRGRYNEDHFMHERISALMRENEHNNISMRTLQNENVELKGSIEACTNTIQLVHTEMTGLKTIANDGLSKLRAKEKKLLEEQRKDKDAIAAMERKLENANSLIRSLRSSSSRYYDEQGRGIISNLNAISHSKDRVNSRSRMEDYHVTPPRDTKNERQFAAELSTEKELRYKAEEICAGVLANSKVALEERDSEISMLRAQLFRLSSKKHSNGR